MIRNIKWHFKKQKLKAKPDTLYKGCTNPCCSYAEFGSGHKRVSFGNTVCKMSLDVSLHQCLWGSFLWFLLWYTLWLEELAWWPSMWSVPFYLQVYTRAVNIVKGHRLWSHLFLLALCNYLSSVLWMGVMRYHMDVRIECSNICPWYPRHVQ